jgi:Tol biopolymer transport system component
MRIRLAFVIAATLLFATTAPAAAPPATELISTGDAGQWGNADNCYPAASADARYVVFTSLADNLVISDTNGVEDIFLRDRLAGTTVRINLGPGGEQANQWSSDPTISADGHYIAYHSLASNLVISDTNNALDGFVYDRQTGVTTRVSVSSAGAQGDGDSDFPLLSADGQRVAFRSVATNLVVSDTNNALDWFVRDLVAGTTVRVSVASDGTQADGASTYGSFAPDGSAVVFASAATNLVISDTNGLNDIFVHTLLSGTTERVNVTSSGAQATGGWSDFPSLTTDGRMVAFTSAADNLVTGDTNGQPDIFVHDRQTGVTTRVNLSSAGAEAQGGSSGDPVLSADGRLVAFSSGATNLAPDDTNAQEDTFVHDRLTGLTLRASVSITGSQALNGWSSEPQLTPDGRVLFFGSRADNLVPGDTNNATDAFLRQLGVYQAYIPFVGR